jgi:hypothetical protein
MKALLLTSVAAAAALFGMNAWTKNDERAVAVAAFEQMARVMTSPRCQNCHTTTSFPTQGDDLHRHQFGVTRGDDGMGAIGLRCATCHGKANNAASGVPGANEPWRAAPLSMGWEGHSTVELCQHLKDARRNGGRSGTAVIEHLRSNLVTWAWDPGTDSHGRQRRRPPLDYATFMRAVQTWVNASEACPDTAR